MVVARRGQHFDHARRDVKDRHVERTAAQIIDHDFLVFLAVNAVGKRGSRRLINNTLDIEPSNFAGVLGGLALGVGKIGRHGDDCIGYRLAKIAFCVRLQLQQDHSRDLLRRILVPVDADAVICAHLAFDRADCPVVVGHGLPFCDLADQPLAGFGKRNDGWRRSAALGVGNDSRFAALHHGHAGIGGAEIDADHDCHAVCLLIYCELSSLRLLLRAG